MSSCIIPFGVTFTRLTKALCTLPHLLELEFSHFDMRNGSEVKALSVHLLGDKILRVLKLRCGLASRWGGGVGWGGGGGGLAQTVDTRADCCLNNKLFQKIKQVMPQGIEVLNFARGWWHVGVGGWGGGGAATCNNLVV